MRADIVALAVEGGWIVDQKKQIEDDVGWHNVFVKCHLCSFGVASGTQGNLVVCRRGHVAAGVAADDIFDALDAAINGVQAPETSSSKYICNHIPIILVIMETDEFRRLVRQQGEELYRDMPWRRDTRPYYVLVSELMLQQTQVDRVIPKFESFIAKFPDEKALAEASLADVLREWQGLGYNRRAKFLHEAAKTIVEVDGFPEDEAGLVMLPGVGKNTAGAIAAYAYNQPAVFIETNVRTVYIHHFFEDSDMVDDKEIRNVLEQTIDFEYPREFYWALMDYGHWLKKQGVKPSRSRHHKKQSALKGSVREVRGQIIAILAKRDETEASLRQLLAADERFLPALDSLTRDGLVAKTDDRYHLTR